MVWRGFLLTAGLVSALFGAGVTAANATCGGNDLYTSGCVSGEFGNGGVDLSGTIQTPGSPGAPGDHAGGSPGSGGSGGGSGANAGGTPGTGTGSGSDSGPIDAGPCGPGVTLVAVPGGEMCMAEAIPTIPGDPGDATVGTPALPPVTLSAIAHFRPDPPRQRMQPDGWTIAGLHTNFYALTRTQVVVGSLFGIPAEVRFTPVEYHWNYGDGNRASRSTPGASWEALGVAEFDRTPNSHVYAANGDYLIHLNVDHIAEYRYAGSPWHPIPGILRLPANELRITAGGAQTVLVGDDCLVNPAGPGCR